jgi:MFS transporter, DHA3 family, multidrug efflux protein
MSSKARAIDLRRSTDRTFVHLLVNTLLVSVINFTMWFAVTFWVFLETHSVLATGIVAGIFLLTPPPAESGLAAWWTATARKPSCKRLRSSR